jgi:hypothetical protein
MICACKRNGTNLARNRVALKDAHCAWLTPTAFWGISRLRISPNSIIIVASSTNTSKTYSTHTSFPKTSVKCCTRASKRSSVLAHYISVSCISSCKPCVEAIRRKTKSLWRWCCCFVINYLFVRLNDSSNDALSLTRVIGATEHYSYPEQL